MCRRSRLSFVGRVGKIIYVVKTGWIVKTRCVVKADEVVTTVREGRLFAGQGLGRQRL